MNCLNGKVAVVTGAGRGLGRATALAFAAEGARVVVNDPGGSISGGGSDPDVADQVVSSINSSGGHAVANYDPVGSVHSSLRIVDSALANFGRIDILVNNAGISRQNMIWDMPESDFDEVIRTHLKGTWSCMKAAIPHMIQQRGGSIINMSSGVSVIGAVANCSYTAAKAGTIGLHLRRSSRSRALRHSGQCAFSRGKQSPGSQKRTLARRVPGRIATAHE